MGVFTFCYTVKIARKWDTRRETITAGFQLQHTELVSTSSFREDGESEEGKRESRCECIHGSCQRSLRHSERGCAFHTRELAVRVSLTSVCSTLFSYLIIFTYIFTYSSMITDCNKRWTLFLYSLAAIISTNVKEIAKKVIKTGTGLLTLHYALDF